MIMEVVHTALDAVARLWQDIEERRWIFYTTIALGTSFAALTLRRAISVTHDAIVRRKILSRKERIIIFSRYPVPGKCKTRLIPLLGERGAALCQLHMTNNLLRSFLHDPLSAERSGSDDRWSVELRYVGGTQQQMRHWMVPFSPGRQRAALLWRLQVAGDLGQKMAEAFRTAFAEGAERVVLIGSDIPGVTRDIVTMAMETLASTNDPSRPLSGDAVAPSPFVLGPALDGGYYLVAAHCSILDKLDALFTGMTWGTDVVREQQVEVAHSLGIETSILQEELSDLDVPSDFEAIGSCFGLQAVDFMSPSVAVVIPTLNEGANIEECILHTVQQAAYPENLEIIVSDGGSTDATCDKVLELVDLFRDLRHASLRLVHTRPGRGVQQNVAAATIDKASYVAFLHADTRLPPEFDKRIVDCLGIPGNVMGAFHFRLDCLEPDGPPASWWFRFQMTTLCALVRRRVLTSEMPYGDQGLFMALQTFRRCGGFRPVRLFEDYIMVKTMQQLGHVQMAAGGPSITSSRRWMKHGYIKISGLNQFLLLAYSIGVHPDTLANIYYGKPEQAGAGKQE